MRKALFELEWLCRMRFLVSSGYTSLLHDTLAAAHDVLDGAVHEERNVSVEPEAALRDTRARELLPGTRSPSRMFAIRCLELVLRARGCALVLVVLYEAGALIASEACGPRRAVCQ